MKGGAASTIARRIASSFIVFSCSLAAAHFTTLHAHFFPNISTSPPSTAGWDVFNTYLGCHAGEHVPGLASLKKYFHYFGYIPAASNFTDDFDAVLQSAVKTYQLNFNLNATGDLDAPTIQHMMRPRCGNPDIINATSTMASGRKPPPGSAIHVVGHYSFFQGRPRWPQASTQLTYAFFPENQLTDAVKSVFARAFARWSAVIPLNFTHTPTYTSADIRIGFYVGDHGDGEAFDGSMGTLAHAFSPPSGHLHMDGDENWVLDGDSLNVPASVDLESVAVHEIGHMLGLGHSSVEDAIMYPTLATGTRRVELAGDDIQGIQELYGSNPTFQAPANAFRRGDDSSGAHTLYLLSTLWLLVVALVCLFILYY
ncbi:unnamed protein product [Cuscuta europaea]|uniref:Peptidase metallopeptidase domain-containing protein n=1 Tax=Cuscuta europaea TaxID=41803 RepID=A0A9P0ZDF5_CUSEU|nr:unnamed protein product [Cuscuta europaea]